MFVADDRVEEYTAAGHKPVADSFEVKTEEPVKKVAKRQQLRRSEVARWHHMQRLKMFKSE